MSAETFADGDRVTIEDDGRRVPGIVGSKVLDDGRVQVWLPSIARGGLALSSRYVQPDQIERDERSGR